MKTYIYFLISDNGECVYIGKTGDMKSRISKHMKKRAFANCIFIEIENTLLANLSEMYFIARYNPLENIDYKEIVWTSSIKYFDEILENNAYLYRFNGKHEKLKSVTLVKRERNVPLEQLSTNFYTYKVYKRVKCSDDYAYSDTKLELVEIGICENIDEQYKKLMRKVKQGKMEHDFKLYYCTHLDKVDAHLQYTLLSLELYEESKNRYIEGVADFMGSYIDPLTLVDSRYSEFRTYREYIPESFSLNCEIKDEEVLRYMLSRGEFCKEDKRGSISYSNFITETIKKTLYKNRLEGISYVIALLDRNDVVIDFDIFNLQYTDVTEKYIIELSKYKASRTFKKYLVHKRLPSHRLYRDEIIEELQDIVEVEISNDMPVIYNVNYEIYFVKDVYELNGVEGDLLNLMEKNISARDAEPHERRYIEKVKSFKSKADVTMV